jgi:hypothetical protein
MNDAASAGDRTLSTDAVTDAVLRWSRAIEGARRWRGSVVALLAVLIPLIAAPIRLSPKQAAVIGGIGLLLVAWFVMIVIVWNKVYRPAMRSSAEALTRLLERSQAVRKLEDRGENPTDDDRRITDPLNRPNVRKYVELAIRIVGGPNLRADELNTELPLSSELESRVHSAAPALKAASVLRIIGPAWLLLGFLATWVSVSLLVWASDPAVCSMGTPNCPGAFQGLAPHPTLGDFLYFVLNAAVVNVLPDITVRSPLGHALYSGIVISGLALLSTYATQLWTSAQAQIGAARD